jgi:hypothetical protein
MYLRVNLRLQIPRVENWYSRFDSDRNKRVGRVERVDSPKRVEIPITLTSYIILQMICFYEKLNKNSTRWAWW